jgi:metal-sulfur cluster biosynthetic enzyme
MNGFDFMALIAGARALYPKAADAATVSTPTEVSTGPEETRSPCAIAEQAWAALRGVIDPEIGLDIVTVGLVYDVQVEGRTILVTFTLTTPGCPMAEIITDGIRAAVTLALDGFEVHPILVWEPRWDPGMMQEVPW